MSHVESSSRVIKRMGGQDDDDGYEIAYNYEEEDDDNEHHYDEYNDINNGNNEEDEMPTWQEESGDYEAVPGGDDTETELLRGGRKEKGKIAWLMRQVFCELYSIFEIFCLAITATATSLLIHLI